MKRYEWTLRTVAAGTGTGALLWLLSSAAAAITVGDPAPGAPTAAQGVRASAADGRSTLAEIADLAVDAYYRSRPLQDGTNQNALWGIQARSSIPVVDARADFDFSLFLPADSGAETVANESNHMVRLTLEDHWNKLDYGATFYSVGDSFQHQPLARQHLNASGLGQPGQGSEVWLESRWRPLGIRPSVRHRQIVQEFGEVENHSDATIVGLARAIPTGSVYLRNALIDDQTGDQGIVSRSRWEFGANVRPVGSLVLSPMVAQVTSETPLGLTLQSRTAVLSLNTRLADATHLNLRLQHDARETANGMLDVTAANLNVTAPFRFGGLSAPGFTVSAAMGYQEQRGAIEAQNWGAFSVQLRLNYLVDG